jgi:hypothetical protein
VLTQRLGDGMPWFVRVFARLRYATSEFLLALGLAVRSEANKVIRKPLVWHRIIHTG